MRPAQKIEVEDLRTGKKSVYKSQVDAARALKISKASISNGIKGNIVCGYKIRRVSGGRKSVD